METRFSRFSRNARHHVLCLFIYLFFRLDPVFPGRWILPAQRGRRAPAPALSRQMGEKSVGRRAALHPPAVRDPHHAHQRASFFRGAWAARIEGGAQSTCPPALQRARLRRQPAHRDTGGRWPKRGDRGRRLSPRPAAPPAGVCPGFPLLPPFHLSLLSAEFFGKSLV